MQSVCGRRQKFRLECLSPVIRASQRAAHFRNPSQNSPNKSSLGPKYSLYRRGLLSFCSHICPLSPNVITKAQTHTARELQPSEWHEYHKPLPFKSMLMHRMTRPFWNSGTWFLTRSYNHIFYRTNITIAHVVPQCLGPLTAKKNIAFDFYFLRYSKLFGHTYPGHKAHKDTIQLCNRP